MQPISPPPRCFSLLQANLHRTTGRGGGEEEEEDEGVEGVEGKGAEVENSAPSSAYFPPGFF